MVLSEKTKAQREGYDKCILCTKVFAREFHKKALAVKVFHCIIFYPRVVTAISRHLLAYD